MARHAWWREIKGSATQSFMTVVLLAGLLILALWHWSKGEASPGDVTFVMTSYFVVNGYLREVGAHVRNLQQAVNEMEDLVRFKRRAPKIDEAAGEPAMAATPGRIALDGVTFGYGSQQRARRGDAVGRKEG